MSILHDRKGFKARIVILPLSSESGIIMTDRSLGDVEEREVMSFLPWRAFFQDKIGARWRQEGRREGGKAFCLTPTNSLVRCIKK